MKKTLFLSAMLAAALCSSAFGATAVTVDVTSTNTPVDLHDYDGTNLLDGEHVITLTMAHDTKITNGGRNCGETSVQIGSITVGAAGADPATAELEATTGSWYGIINSDYNQATLALNGGTLKKVGSGEMLIANTQASAGTLNLAEGKIRLLSKNKGTYSLDGENLTLTAATGTTLQVDKNARLKRFNSSGTVTFNNNAELCTTYLTLTSGSVSGNGKLYINGNTDGGNNNIDIDLSLVTSAIKLRQAKGTLRAAAGNITANIELENHSWAGAEWNTVDGDAYTFTGAISGDDGNMAFSCNKTVALTFSGDLSGWNTRSNAETDAYREYKGLRVNGTTIINLTLNGTPTNTTVGNAFNRNSGAQLNMTIDRNAKFLGAVNATKFTLNANKHAEVTNTAKLGTLVLGAGSELAVTSGSSFTCTATTDGNSINGEGNHTIRLGNNSTLTIGGKLWLNNQSLEVQNTTVDDVTTGGTLSLNCLLAGVSDSTTNSGNLTIAEGNTVRITGTATGADSNVGLVIWNAAQHEFSINGALIVDHAAGIHRKGSTSVTHSTETYNIGDTGLLQLNEGLTFKSNDAALTAMGTINVNGGTLAIGGQTTGSKAAAVNLADGAKVVAIDVTTSTEQEFTIADGATVTLSGKGTDGTANNKLIVNSDLNGSNATVKMEGNVELSSIQSANGDLLVLGSVNLNNNSHVANLTLLSGSVTVKDNHSGLLELDKLTVTGENTTINANLVINDNGMLDFSAGNVLTMGCDVTLGSGVTVQLSSEKYAELIALGEGDSILLVQGADSFNGLTESFSTTINVQGGQEQSGTFILNFNKDAQTLSLVPEPATATLSLLALAGLAARRRRH